MDESLSQQYERKAADLNLPSLTVTPVQYERHMRLFGKNGGYAACRVTFYSGGQKYQINGRSDGALNFSGASAIARNSDMELDGDLISVHTDKSLDAPAGTFTVTMHDRPMRAGNRVGLRLAEVVMPNDVVAISFKRSDSDLSAKKTYPGGQTVSPTDDWECVMVGIVGARPTVSWSIDGNEATARRVTITGFDFGKLLLNNQIYFYKDVPSVDITAFALKGWQYLKNGTFPAGTKAKLIQVAIDDIFRKTTSFTVDVNDGVSIGSLFGYSLRSTYGTLPVGVNFFSQEQTMWAFIESIAEKPWCELFVDTLPQGADFYRAFKDGSDATIESLAQNAVDGGRPTLFLRQTPFSQDEWVKLPVYYISDDVVHNLSLGGEPTLYNLFYARPAAYLTMGSVMSAYLTGVPIFDEASFKKHGLRMLVTESKVFPYDKAGAAIKQVGLDLTRKLYEWFAPSQYFLSGSITVQGHPSYRIGTRLRRVSGHDHDSQGCSEFYIEGVTQEWNAFDGYKTTLRVTRGLYLGDKVDRHPDPPTPNYDTQASAEYIQVASEGSSA